MTINEMIPDSYHCPRCFTTAVKEELRTIYCVRCKLTFSKRFIKLLEDEDILANEELKGMMDVFFDNVDPKQKLDDKNNLDLP